MTPAEADDGPPPFEDEEEQAAAAQAGHPSPCHAHPSTEVVQDAGQVRIRGEATTLAQQPTGPRQQAPANTPMEAPTGRQWGSSRQPGGTQPRAHPYTPMGPRVRQNVRHAEWEDRMETHQVFARSTLSSIRSTLRTGLQSIEARITDGFKAIADAITESSRARQEDLRVQREAHDREHQDHVNAMERVTCVMAQWASQSQALPPVVSDTPVVMHQLLQGRARGCEAVIDMACTPMDLTTSSRQQGILSPPNHPVAPTTAGTVQGMSASQAAPISCPAAPAAPLRIPWDVTPADGTTQPSTAPVPAPRPMSGSGALHVVRSRRSERLESRK